jgi:hypothetical protein
MISAATQSTAKTVPGQRYMLVIYNPTAEWVTPHVRFATPLGNYITPLTPDNSHDAPSWYDGEFKHITFVAWADELMLTTTTHLIFWRMIPIHT